MTKHQLFHHILYKQSFLCIGLDPDKKKIPTHLLTKEDPVFSFNQAIIDATEPYCIAYKPNLAFYEALGIDGLISLKKTIEYIRKRYPKQFIIADAKRGDIGNTAEMYAHAIFDFADYDAVTVAPYMGQDSVKPFLIYQGKWIALLALTSSPGANDFQLTVDAKGEYLFEKVIRKSLKWATDEQMMYVVGGTQSNMIRKIRKIIPDHFLLVPGIGLQGGNLSEVVNSGMNTQVGLIINSSRQIIYADSSEQFSVKAAREAEKLQSEMAIYLQQL